MLNVQFEYGFFKTTTTIINDWITSYQGLYCDLCSQFLIVGHMCYILIFAYYYQHGDKHLCA